MGGYLLKVGSSVEGGRRWHCQSGAVFGLVVVGFGDLTGFGLILQYAKSVQNLIKMLSR